MFSKRLLCCLALLACAYPLFRLRLWHVLFSRNNRTHAPLHIQAAIARCRSLQHEPGPLPDFWKRSRSDRYETGTRPVLIRGGRIWTGRDNGTEVIRGDILMDKGMIKSVGKLGTLSLASVGNDLLVFDVNGAWVTPGLVDAHSHIGDYSLPYLKGAADGNSPLGIVQPWLRSLDGLNTHDESYPLSLAGGVTTSLVLPGSANAIGGQAFVIKLRETLEKSPSSMLVESPYHLNETFPNSNFPPRWRHIKHACGENPSRNYHGTRMDTNWAFREAYAKARKIMQEQDKFCENVLSGKWGHNDHFPEELKWEALVDVLRGRVKVNTHCYEAIDIDDFVRLTNEFRFSVAAFHHASEAYLVPDLIKRAYGKPPALALFATFGRYKREAYRASEFAPRILSQNGLTVLMKSDHPAINSRYLIYEAQQAFFYGLPHNLALASVTSNSAQVLGMGHRLGYIREGWDADVVIWDSHPLALGATPAQVFVDGIPQLRAPAKIQKPANFQRLPKVPNFDAEVQDTIKHDGLPPLEPEIKSPGTTVFVNVKSVYRAQSSGVQQMHITRSSAELGVVVVQNGSITCSGLREACFMGISSLDSEITTIDLDGGSISPGFVSYGSPLGLEAISQEPSTNDGDVPDPLVKPVPKLLGGDFVLVHAADGLQYGTRDALLAYRSGVTSAVTAPAHRAFVGGLGVSFSLGASNKLERNALIQEITGLHISIGHFSRPSVSSQIAALRRLLLGPPIGAIGAFFEKVQQGTIPLVIEAHNADIIATLLILKSEVETKTKRNFKMTITGATEAHILAKELAEARVGVILTPARPLPSTWEKRRILPGPPFSKETSLSILLRHGVIVGIGCEEIWAARSLPFDIAWAAIQAGGQITKEEAFTIGSVNVEKLLGVDRDVSRMDLVATSGGDLLDFGAQVVAVISPEQELVNVIRQS